jgi:hypothetical protein
MIRFHEMKGTILCILGMSFFILSSCCSLVNTTRQTITIASNPPGALVKINGRDRGRTPLSFELERKDNHEVEILLDGYQPHRIVTSRSPSMWVLGDLVCTLLLVPIDALDGAAFNIDPTNIEVHLEKSGPETSVP